MTKEEPRLDVLPLAERITAWKEVEDWIRCWLAKVGWGVLDDVCAEMDTSLCASDLADEFRHGVELALLKSARPEYPCDPPPDYGIATQAGYDAMAEHVKRARKA